MGKRKFAAVIPAAGYSSRMGVFKPLLPIGSLLVIEKAVLCFQEADIRDICVVVGHRHELLIPILDRLAVTWVVNADYASGMFSSIRAGVQTLEADVEAFFVLPGDIPLVQPRTILEIQAAYGQDPVYVVYPCYKKMRGHPPLISARLRSVILGDSPKGSLMEILKYHEADCLEIPVEDPGILMDMDNMEDYRTIFKERFVDCPSEEACLNLLRDSKVPDPVVRHSKAVAALGVRISEHLNSSGNRIHLGLVAAAGLVHDIARGEPDHAQKGRDMIRRLGYPEVADICGSHMDLSPDTAGELNEKSILFLADKMIREDSLIPLEERYSDMLKKYDSDTLVQQKIKERFDRALKIKKKIERVLNQRVEYLL